RGRDGGLDEHLVQGIVAVDLDDITEGDAAARLRVAPIACQRGLYRADRGRQIIAPCRYAIAEPIRFQRLELGGIVGLSLIALTNLSRSFEHHDDTMNSTYCTFSLS